MKKILVLLLVSYSVFAQKFGGIEIGGKGIKVTVLNVLNIEDGKFETIKNWTRNTAVTKNLSIDKKLAKVDIDETANAVSEILGQLKNDFQLPDDKIFVIASSGVAMAINKQDLADKVKLLTGRNLEFVTSEQEGKLVTKGAVPAKKYKASLVMDIGGGNTKGGYVNQEDNYYYFYPVAFDLGSVTMTERIKKNAGSSEFKDFIAATQTFNDTLKVIVKNMYDNKPAARRKENVYMIGGAVWSFISLTKPGNTENFVKFTYNDVIKYNYDLINNWEILTSGNFSNIIDSKIREGAEKDFNKVMDTYPKEGLIAGSQIMLAVLGDLDKPELKNVYFVRSGSTAWLVAYVVDSLRKQNSNKN